MTLTAITRRDFMSRGGLVAAASVAPGIHINEYALVAAMCRGKGGFYEFVKEFWEVLNPEPATWNWHIKYLCDLFEEAAYRVLRGETRDFDYIVNVPPGSTKSTIFSIMGPAWIWAIMPHARIICGSHTQLLALDLATKSRTVITSDKYRACFPEVVLSDDQNTKGYFANTKRGMRYSIGAGGSVIGMHAHFIIVDDPIDPTAVTSDEELKAVNSWVCETLPSRKVNKLVTVTWLIMQRLHQNDPVGYQIDNPKRRDQIFWVCLPAEETEHVSPPELKANYIDGLLDVIRLPLALLRSISEDPAWSTAYPAQYLQWPVPAGGAMFHADEMLARITEINQVPSLSDFKLLVRYWDKAGTGGDGAFTVGVLMGLDKWGRIWILDVIRDRWDSSKRELEIVATAKKDGKPVRIGIEQEPGSGGKESAEGTVRRLRGYIVLVDKPTGKKELRADPYATQVNGGNVYLRRAPWNKAFIEEHRFFPFSRYKDQVDAAGGGCAILLRPRLRVGAL